MKENWAVISPSKDKWKNDIKWIYSKDEYKYKLFLRQLYFYSLGDFLDSVCKIIKGDNCTILSIGFTVLCYGDKTVKPLQE